ncbi:hypothetical protein GGI07_004151 [Coemansia sp. Benny D115]|nr:hypothetical protein GGI07_004151 [Coemansia sp. Benny D115]
MQARSPTGLTIPGASGKSSVVDRVKWIEKTHGSNAAIVTAPKARLRLPKNFQSDTTASSTAALGRSPEPTSPRGGLEQAFDTMEKQAVNSPALSQTSTLELHPTPTEEQAGIHKRTESQESDSIESIVSLRDDAEGFLYRSRSSSCSSLGEIGADPVHVQKSSSSASDGGRANSQGSGAPSTLSASEASGGRRYARPASAAARDDAGSASGRSLGGIRSRAAPVAARRFNRSHQSASTCSLPGTGAQDAEAGGRPVSNTSSVASEIIGEDDGPQSPTGTLLSRLNRLAASRPRVQDLVSNRSSPKFVKRSPHFNSVPIADAQVHSFISAPKRNTSKTPQKRYI